MKAYFKNHSIILWVLILVCLPGMVLAQNTQVLKRDIYSKLKCCPCKETFAHCKCVEAKQMKAYIDALLENDISQEDILYKVAKKFSLKVITDEQIKADLEQRLLKEVNNEYSKIVFEPAALNFGPMSKATGKASKTVRLYNKGDIDLVISNLRASCDCTTASLKAGKDKSPYFGIAGANPGWQAIIKPGDFGELEVVLDLNHSSMGSGKQIRNIFISSNDPVNPQADLSAQIEVQQ